MTKYIDISWPISVPMTQYKDNSVVKIIQTKAFDEHGMFQTELQLSSHTGTHVDAPYHVFPDGKRSEHLEVIVGPCKIFDFTQVENAVTEHDLQKNAIVAGDIILLKTRNSFLPVTDHFVHDFVYLTAGGAEYLQQQRVKAVGIDYLGLEREQPGHPSHKILLGADIFVIEGLRLEKAREGVSYTFWCFPLYIVGIEAAPARAVLAYECDQ